MSNADVSLYSLVCSSCWSARCSHSLVAGSSCKSRPVLTRLIVPQVTQNLRGKDPEWSVSYSLDIPYSGV